MFLIRSIAKKITSLLSGVRIPRQYQRDDLRIEEYPYIETKIFQILPVLISDNYCLIISQIRVSDNLLPVAPEIFEKSELIQPVKSYELEEQLSFAIPKIFDKTSLFEINIANSYNRTEVIPEVKTFSYDKIRLSPPIIWNNLFESLLEPSIKGKVFTKEIKTKNLNNLQPVARIRKAASPGKALSHWDLLYPSLCPPLLLEFSEEIDLFKPLRGYQKEGVNFLVEHPSALLADEMGTGKTVQTLNSVRILFRQGKIYCVLIVCPLAIIGSAKLSVETGKSEGWDGHFYHWDKDLLVTVLKDNPEQRKIDWAIPAHIYITNYETLRNDLEKGILKEADIKKIDCVILDEAQKIKNRNSRISKAISKLNPKYRWALTGTPIENKIEDVISIFEFVKPGLFRQGVEYSPQQVKSMIEPYMLRRLKQQVLKDLPPKIYQEDWLELDINQKTAYEEALKSGRRQLEESVQAESNSQVTTHVFALLKKLTQICNFAYGNPTSPKTELLLDYIETISARGNKLLVFSQYIEEGIEKIEKLLKRKGIGCVSYTGKMSEQQRNTAINDFRNQPNIYVFLGTFKAVGTGLTLTEASYVIHFDHWWNPATMKQAEDRAHRMGQANTLNVYSFWMRDTVEEKIKKKLYEKGLLIESVIDSLAEEGIESSLTTKDWLDVFGIKATTKQEKTKDKVPVSSQANTDLIEPMIDFAIITAIDMERQAICQDFQMTAKHRVRKGSRVYWRNRLELKDGNYYEIVVAQLPDMSNVEAALMASDIMRDWQPEAMLMVGIAGAARPNQQLGDLIIARDIYYYERGKETPDGKMPEPVMYRADATLLNQVIATSEWNEPISVARPDNTEVRPKIYREAIASGEKVIADAVVRDEIAAQHRKIMAFEMEGYGVSAAAWQSFERVRHLVIRSICDFADSSKNSEWHPYAAAVAAGYTKHFLLDRPLEPRNPSV